jgi:predicted SnoaL-like aldol condensation-catalyzing enzyme
MFPRSEVEEAFAEFRARGVGHHDWPGWCELFTNDARYIEHNMGTFEGRDAIREWIVKTMADFSAMSFDFDWWIIGTDRVVFNIWNLLPDPAGGGAHYGFTNATVIEYAGDGRWSFEEDYYNPATANAEVGRWLKAGGNLHAPPDRTLRADPDARPQPVADAHPAEEVEREFWAYVERGRQAVATGDWVTWAAQFTPDAHYLEHHYGAFEGRQAITEWITGVMQPFPSMEFPVEWHMVDGNRVVMLCQNRLPDPAGEGRIFEFPTLVHLNYAGDGQWSYEEDIYNPAEAPPVVSAWIEAGGSL